jgi:RHS repeat-associated protein
MSYAIDPSDNVLKILNEDHYYPFGMKHYGYNAGTGRIRFHKGLAQLMLTDDVDAGYKYKYNGKEWQDELGLNVTAMDFRQYDNAIGRFYNIDVMSDIMPSISPYRFGFNNPVIWKDPSGLFESGGDDDCDCPPIIWKEVVITGYKNMPSYFPTYFLKNGVNLVRYPGTQDEYNKQFGTNYHGDRYLDQWYFVNYYKPFKEEMINSMHAAQKKAGLFVMGVGGAVYAAPILLASPAVTSAISATISNPITQRALVLGGTNHFSQLLINGKVDQADVAISMIPGGPGLQAMKPMFSTSVDFYSTSDYSFIGGTGNMNKSNASFYRDAATGYIFHGLSFGVSPSNGLRNFGEIPLNTVLNTGQNSMSNLLEKDGWE